MKALFLVLMIISPGIHMIAQDTLTARRANPHFWISLYGNPFLQSGPQKVSCRLYEVKDSSLVVTETSKLAYLNSGRFETMEINLGQVRSISYRNQYNVYIEMLIGGLTGLAVGAIIGQQEEDDLEGWLPQTAEEKAAADMVLGTLTGVGIGALISLIRVDIPINGRMDHYHAAKSRLEKKSVKHKYLSGK